MAAEFTSKSIHRCVLFGKNSKRPPLWYTGVYLEKCQSRNGLLLISENVKVNGVYFDPKKSTHTGHTVHTGYYTHTTSSIYRRYGTGLLFYFPWKYHNGGRLPGIVKVMACQRCFYYFHRFPQNPVLFFLRFYPRISKLQTIILLSTHSTVENAASLQLVKWISSSSTCLS